MARPRRTPPARSRALTRRHFLRASAATAAGVTLGAYARAYSRAVNEQLRIAQIGCGGMGAADLGDVSRAPHARIVALCDVDQNNLQAGAQRFPEARSFRDFRKLLEAMHAELDAVVVSTPDHMHGPIALAAMDLGKHVYCQKPIAHNLRECRAMKAMAERKGVVTQMGTQIHSHSAYKTAVAMLRSGAIGKVSEAHSWVSKSWAGPPEGAGGRSDPVPATLDWDLWLGVAKERPYVNGIYHPARWRGFRPFGSGTLGDMGCHIFDPVFSALGLGSPVAATSHGPAHYEDTFAPDGDVHYEFAGTEFTTDAPTLRWTDGSAASRPDASRAQLPEGVNLPGAGSFLVGENGVMVVPHWSMPQFYAANAAMEVAPAPEAGCNHYHEWVAACRGDGEASTPFTYSGPLTEAVLLGVVAAQYPGVRVGWNAESLEVDHGPAQELVGRNYRDGWEPAGLLP